MAMRLEPTYPAFFLSSLGYAYDQAGRYEESLEVRKKFLDRALKGEDEIIDAHRHLAVGYARLNMMEEAIFHASEMLKIDPGFSIDRWRKQPINSIIKDQKWLDSKAEMMRKAGIPKHPPLKLPDKPSIAVLPFDNMSGDKTQEYIADGITESIITALSKVPSLFVIARNSSFTYKGKPVKVQKVSKELGVQYVLEGSVQKSEDRIRINAQLIDAIKGHHLWAEKYDRELKDIFVLQDDIALNILKELNVELSGVNKEYARVVQDTDNPDAYLKFIKGVDHIIRFNKEDNSIARKLFEEAIELDPRYTSAYWLVGETYYAEIWGFYSENPEESIAKVAEWAQKTLTLDDAHAGGHSLMSNFYKMTGKIEKAIAEGERAIAFSPNGAEFHVHQAEILKIADRPEDALKLMKKAMRLNPMPPINYYYSLGSTYHMLGRYKEAIDTYEKMFSHMDNNEFFSYMGHVGITFANLELGQETEARNHAAKALKLRSDDILAWAAAICRYKDIAYLKQLSEPLDSLFYANAEAREVYMNDSAPFFKFEYPAGSVNSKQSLSYLNPVVHLMAPSGVFIAVLVSDKPENMSLAEVGANYFMKRIKNDLAGSNIKILSNKPIVLADGTKAYRTEIEYLISTGAQTLDTVIISAFRDKKLVTIIAHTTAGGQRDWAWIPESLAFE
jgi:TolB-like protein